MYSPDDEDSLASQEHLAFMLSRLQDDDEAEDIARHVVADRGTYYWTLDVVSILAKNLGHRGRYQGAIPLIERASLETEKQSGTKHMNKKVYSDVVASAKHRQVQLKDDILQTMTHFSKHRERLFPPYRYNQRTDLLYEDMVHSVCTSATQLNNACSVAQLRYRTTRSRRYGTIKRRKTSHYVTARVLLLGLDALSTYKVAGVAWMQGVPVCRTSYSASSEARSSEPSFPSSLHAPKRSRESCA